MTFEELKDKCKDDIGEIVITECHRVLKLIGVEDDPEDYYYVLKGWDNELHYESACGRYYRLKGKLDDKDYERIKNNIETNIRMREEYKKRQMQK